MICYNIYAHIFAIISEYIQIKTYAAFLSHMAYHRRLGGLYNVICVYWKYLLPSCLTCHGEILHNARSLGLIKPTH